MLRMNVNMIRLHCHFSNPEFYDLADEPGVLLWQDFLEAWYPEDRAFSLRAAELYDPHPVRAQSSFGRLWTTCDEESLENYRDLTKHLAPRPAFSTLSAVPWSRSTGRYGDCARLPRLVWRLPLGIQKMSEVFVSASSGRPSLPNYETLIKFMPDQWPIRISTPTNGNAENSRFPRR